MGLDAKRTCIGTEYLEDCKLLFEKSMSITLGHAWRESDQVKALLTLCNVDNRNDFLGKLEHMRLDPRPNEFVEAKQAGLVLAEYINKA